MNEITPFKSLVEHTKGLLNAVRGSLIRVGENLFTLKKELPKDTVWREFLEEEFGIKESFASKLMTVYKTFVLDGGIEPARLEGVDYEKLYLAKDLEGDIEDKLSKALTLTRREIKEEKNEEHGHEHEAVEITLCKKCGLRL